MPLCAPHPLASGVPGIRPPAAPFPGSPQGAPATTTITLLRTHTSVSRRRHSCPAASRSTVLPGGAEPRDCPTPKPTAAASREEPPPPFSHRTAARIPSGPGPILPYSKPALRHSGQSQHVTSRGQGPPHCFLDRTSTLPHPTASSHTEPLLPQSPRPGVPAPGAPVPSYPHASPLLPHPTCKGNFLGGACPEPGTQESPFAE